MAKDYEQPPSREQLYRFVDKSDCFEKFQHIGENAGDKKYHDSVGALLRASNNREHDFCVGDAMVFRDELIDAGFVWGKDFYMKKV